MSDSRSARSKSKKRGGKFIPALCKTLGIAIIIIAIVLALPLTLPRIFGYDIYNVVSPSMEPEISVGSLIYVKAVDPKSVKAGDIIAFEKDQDVVTHRVVENDTSKGEIKTKGDANQTEDLFPVQYRHLIGKVTLHIPRAGALFMSFASREGKIRAFCFVLSGALLSYVGSVLEKRRKRRKKKR